MANSTIEARLAKLKKQKQHLAEQEKALLRQSRERKLSKLFNAIQSAQLTPSEIGQLVQKLRYLMPETKGKDQLRIQYGIKYVNPDDHQKKWGGRGRPPEWVKRFADADRLNECIAATALNENSAI